MAITGGASSSARPASQSHSPLDGVRICLVFEYNLSHHTRYLREIAVLQEAGATVELLTSHQEPGDVPPGMQVTIAPLQMYDAACSIGPSTKQGGLARGVDNAVRSWQRAASRLLSPGPDNAIREGALMELGSRVDLFWVSDYLSLPTVLDAAERTDTKVVYETVDLVPEFLYYGQGRRRMLLKGERKAVGRVDGFITACDSYADYYMERYGRSVLKRRPVVSDNMPNHMVPHIRPTSRPLRVLFFGQLMSDRPVMELIEAMAITQGDATLTFQGKNYLGDTPSARIAELGLRDRVFLLDPCPPEEIVETASEYDVGIVALRGADENERRASTSKLFTYMSSGLAVLGSNLPGIARVVNEHRNGVLVDGMGPEAWAGAIEALSALPRAEVDAMKQRSLDSASRYAWESQKPAFIAEFVRAMGRTGARPRR